MGRNERGEYVNEKGVVIKVSTDKNGKTHASFYDKDPSESNHSAVHVNIDKDSKKYSASTHNSDKSEKDSHSGNCYLTSACMSHHLEQFDDNCYELSVLRWFRDNFVSKNDIMHYYEIAPIIVQNIDNLENNESIYGYIYDNVIVPCVKAIEMGDYKFAYNRYKSSVLSLEEEFVPKEIEKEHVKSLTLFSKPTLA